MIDRNVVTFEISTGVMDISDAPYVARVERISRTARLIAEAKAEFDASEGMTVKAFVSKRNALGIKGKVS